MIHSINWTISLGNKRMASLSAWSHAVDSWGEGRGRIGLCIPVWVAWLAVALTTLHIKSWRHQLPLFVYISVVHLPDILISILSYVIIINLESVCRWFWKHTCLHTQVPTFSAVDSRPWLLGTHAGQDFALGLFSSPQKYDLEWLSLSVQELISIR